MTNSHGSYQAIWQYMPTHVSVSTYRNRIGIKRLKKKIPSSASTSDDENAFPNEDLLNLVQQKIFLISQTNNYISYDRFSFSAPACAMKSSNRETSMIKDKNRSLVCPGKYLYYFIWKWFSWSNNWCTVRTQMPANPFRKDFLK